MDEEEATRKKSEVKAEARGRPGTRFIKQRQRK